MRKLLAGVGAAGAIAVGGLAVAAVNPVSIGGAEPGAPGGVTAAAAPAAERPGPLAEALAGLVEDETITQAQADAVTEAVKARAAEAREERGGRHRRGVAGRVLRQSLDTAAETIGVTREQLVAGLKDGTSIAAQAQAKGVDPAAVETALVEAGTARIDEAVSNERLDADRAADMKEQLPERAKKLVERTPKPRN